MNIWNWKWSVIFVYVSNITRICDFSHKKNHDSWHNYEGNFVLLSITMYNIWCFLWHMLHWNDNLTLGNNTYYTYYTSLLGKWNRPIHMQASRHAREVYVHKLTWQENMCKQIEMIEKTNQYDRIGKSIWQHNVALWQVDYIDN